MPRSRNFKEILDSIPDSNSENVNPTTPTSTQRNEDRRRQANIENSIEPDSIETDIVISKYENMAIDGRNEVMIIEEKLGGLNSNNQSISEDIEENIEPSFLPKKKRRMYLNFQLNLDSTSDKKEFEEIDKELNENLVKRFNEESGKEAEELAEEIEESTEESDNEWHDEELDKQLAKEKIYSDSNEFEDYSAPNIDDNDQTGFKPNFNPPLEYEWILLWLLKFQSRFNLSEAAINTLIKFIYLILVEISDENQFSHYPNSIYMDDVVGSRNIKEQLEIKKCNHIEFPNVIGT
ncbi:14758_t:CDS:2 [Dentiscutata erythropus]|uniref:14758_t:CDS:1 n=1 Tax=Dentiscutata erythropus TaxID=1348616 RepID=A0A9N9J1J9_9GLOM|nr:14758_t:CDS:2 [Dentiscutata erythropus]